MIHRTRTSETGLVLTISLVVFLAQLMGCAKPEFHSLKSKLDSQVQPPAIAESHCELGLGETGAAQSPLAKVTCLDGQTVELFSNPEIQATVLIFIATDCPIANAYHPELNRLSEKFQEDIEFYLVHSTPDVTNALARTHREEYNLSIPIVMDQEQVLAQAVQAEVTPEAIVLQRGNDVPVYRGAIDNLYADYGKKRRVASKRHLKVALEEIVRGEIVSCPTTTPVGCFISYDD